MNRANYLVLGFLLFWGAYAAQSQPIKPANLHAYARQLEGIWLDEAHFHSLPEAALQTRLLIQVNQDAILDDLIRIRVSHYAHPFIADELLFCLQEGQLQFAEAIRDGQRIDLDYLNYIILDLEVVGKDTLLRYEALEREGENYRQTRLVRLPRQPADPALWACTLQEHLFMFLAEGEYAVYNHQGTLIQAPVWMQPHRADFLAEYGWLSPGFEETCIRASFEIVIIAPQERQLRPLIYHINWNRYEIRLYDTQLSPAQAGESPRLEKGALRYRIVPGPHFRPVGTQL